MPVFGYSPPMDKTFHSVPHSGAIRIPGSKSQTIRAYLIALFAQGKSTIRGALESSDTKACEILVEKSGASFARCGDTVTIDSSHAFGQDSDTMALDCMNSGTTLYLAIGMLASKGEKFTITGDGQLSKRPVSPLLCAYRALGAKTEGESLPFSIQGPLTGGKATISCPTSQYLSSLLLACPLAKGQSIIDVPLLYEKPYVTMTLCWLKEQGIRLSINTEMDHIVIPGGQHYHPFETNVPGDYSSASFFFCLAAMQHSSITVDGLRKDDTQGDKRVLDILEAMGASVIRRDDSVTVKGGAEIHGGTYDLNDIPDALPILAATACLSKEETTFVHVSQARIKETDRISTMHLELEKLGARITEKEDGMTIMGGMPLHGATLDGHGDHRIIMALSILATVIGDITIKGVDAVSVTFPTFYDLLDSLERSPS